jgi:hydroxymethylbilane synthase
VYYSLPMTQSSTPTSILRLGSRGSPLALVQARQAQSAIAQACGVAPEAIEIKVIRTTGDKIQDRPAQDRPVQDRPLAEAGGKGLFTKEIEEALLAGAIDLAVHSSKDLPAFLPAGLTLAAFLPREDPRDALISSKANSLRELPHDALVGTSSPRRQALLMRVRPDLRIAPMRGNVETRLRKIEAGEVDATVLAAAGLKRLGLLSAASALLEVEEFLPAAGQGAIALETRANDDKIRALAATVDDADTATALAAERAFLAALGGSCRTPIAGHAQIKGDTVSFRGLIATIDGRDAVEVFRQGRRADAAALGADAGHDVKARAGAGFFVED